MTTGRPNRRAAALASLRCVPVMPPNLTPGTWAHHCMAKRANPPQAMTPIPTRRCTVLMANLIESNQEQSARPNSFRMSRSPLIEASRWLQQPLARGTADLVWDETPGIRWWLAQAGDSTTRYEYPRPCAGDRYFGVYLRLLT